MSRDGNGTVAVVAGLGESLINFRGSLLRALVQRGYRVVAFAPSASEVAGRLEELGVEARCIPLARTGMNPFSDARATARLYKEFSALRPDVVFSYTIKPVLYASIAARLAGVPVIAAMITGLGYVFTGDSWRRRLLRLAVTRFYRAALRGVHCVFFQNDDDRRHFVAERIVAAHVRIENVQGSGVDLDYYAAAPAPHGLSFLMIARLVADKGVNEYVAAARLLRERYPDIPCRLAGPLDSNPSAIRREQLDAWIKDGTIEYLGELQDVRPAIAQAAVYVLPSYREGMPRTVLEAMSMGRPVITTDVPGCRHSIVHGESGLLVPARDVNALFLAAMRLVESPTLITRMGAAARERAARVFDVERVNTIIIETIQNCLSAESAKSVDGQVPNS